MDIKVTFSGVAAHLTFGPRSNEDAQLLNDALRHPLTAMQVAPTARDALLEGGCELRIPLAKWRSFLRRFGTWLNDNAPITAPMVQFIVDGQAYEDVWEIPKQATLRANLGQLNVADGLLLATDPAAGPEREHYRRFQLVEGTYEAVATLLDSGEHGFEMQHLDLCPADSDTQLTWYPTMQAVKMEGGHAGFFVEDAVTKPMPQRYPFVERCFEVTRDKSEHWQNAADLPVGLVGKDVGVCAYHDDSEAHVPILCSLSGDGTGRFNALRLDFGART